jgi:hypothetical protein
MAPSSMTLLATRTGGSADRFTPAAEGEPDNANAVENAKKLLICQSLTEAASQGAQIRKRVSHGDTRDSTPGLGRF